MLEVHNDMKKIKNKSGKEYKEKKAQMLVLNDELVHIYEIHKLVKGIGIEGNHNQHGGIGCRNLNPLEQLSEDYPIEDEGGLVVVPQAQPVHGVDPYQQIRRQQDQINELSAQLNNFIQQGNQPSSNQRVKWGSIPSYLLLISFIIFGIAAISISPLGSGVGSALKSLSYASNTMVGTTNEMVQDFRGALHESADRIKAYGGNTHVKERLDIQDQTNTIHANRRLTNAQTGVINAQTQQIVAKEQQRSKTFNADRQKLINTVVVLEDSKKYVQQLDKLYGCNGEQLCLNQKLRSDYAVANSEAGKMVLDALDSHLKGLFKGGWSYISTLIDNKIQTEMIENSDIFTTPDEKQRVIRGIQGLSAQTVSTYLLDIGVEDNAVIFGNTNPNARALPNPNIYYNFSNLPNKNNGAILPQMGSQTSVSRLPPLIPKKNNNNNNNNSPY